MKKNWFKERFSGKRILIAAEVSAIIGVTYWATTIYEKAFEIGSIKSGASAFIIVFLVLLILGGSILEAMSKS